MNLNYSQLRRDLEMSPQANWDNIVSDAINESDERPSEIGGKEQGNCFGEILMNADSIQTIFTWMIFGDSVYGDDGPYQDDDGDSYDIEETEYTFSVTITEGSVVWEKV